MLKNAILLALLTISTPALAVEEISRLTLSGTGTVTVEPDEGYITVGVDIVAPTSAEALLTNSTSMSKLFTSLDTLGVAKKDIRTLEFSISEHYAQVDTEKKDAIGNPIYRTVKDGYQVSNLIRVTVCDLEKFGKVLDTVVQDGANRIHGIEFGSSKAGESLEKAREAATADAVRKAKVLTKGLDVSLGRVLNLSEIGGGRRELGYAKRSAAEAESMDVPVSGGTLSYSVSVNVQWELEPNFRLNPPIHIRPIRPLEPKAQDRGEESGKSSP